MSKLKSLNPFLRFKQFDENWNVNILKNLVLDKKIKFINNDNFLDAPSILNKTYSKYINQEFKLAPEDSIVFIKDGSNAGTFAYTKFDTRIASTCDYIYSNKNNLFLSYLLQNKISFIKNNLLIGDIIPHLYKKELVKLVINIPSSSLEQQKIAKFFSLLDKQIELWEKKLHLWEQIYRYLIQKIYEELYLTNDTILFKNIFIEKNNRNINNFSQYTIGKYGLNKINNKKYDISNHKVFKKNYLILGIGTNEVIVNINIESGSCSPIYKTYLISNKKYSLYFFHFLKKIINTSKFKFSKKSTRRENEFDFNALNKFNILVPKDCYFFKINFINNVYEFIKKINRKKELFIKIKKFYLKKCFI